MNSEDLARLKKWFSDYTGSFNSPEPLQRRAVTLKVEHTRRVCENILLIAGEQPSMTDEKLRLTEAVALLHDTGRFPQFERYGTFDDKASINHGRLGAEVLTRERILDELPEKERELILDCVRFHNALKLPSLDGDTLSCLKLLRDADKLDIWRVLLEVYESGESSSAATLGLPDSPECSEEILSSILDKRIGLMSQVKTINDMKLVHLSWVFELNFGATYRLLGERGYMQKMSESLPLTDKVRAAISTMEKFASEKRKEV